MLEVDGDGFLGVIFVGEEKGTCCSKTYKYYMIWFVGSLHFVTMAGANVVSVLKHI